MKDNPNGDLDFIQINWRISLNNESIIAANYDLMFAFRQYTISFPFLCKMQWTTNKLIDLRKQYLDELSSFYDKREALSLINMLIDHFFGLSATTLLTESDYRVSESEMLKLHFAVKELKKYRPVQYIVGETEFLGLNIKVSDVVLIPRPETEELVQLILANEKKEKLSILDIGTGSGCIAISLQKSLVLSSVSAIDISGQALQIAKQNSQLNGVNIKFNTVDILNRNQWSLLDQYDVIVSNPPYVASSEKNLMNENVLENEPHDALFVPDEDPLIFYHAICEFGLTHLNNSGRIYFEINERMTLALIDLIKSFGYINTSVHQDIHGKDRFINLSST